MNANLRAMLPHRRSALRWLVIAAIVGACNEQRIVSSLVTVAPTVAISKTKGDTMDVKQGLQLTVSAAHPLGLAHVHVAFTGGFATQIDSAFHSAVTNFTLPVAITFPQNSPAGGWVQVTATATDGNGHTATVVDSVFLTNIDALFVTLLRPQTGALAAPGKQIQVQVNAHQNKGIVKIGWVAAGAVSRSDSITYAAPFDTTITGPTFSDTLTIPASSTSGTFTVTGFAVDAQSRRVSTNPTTVTIQSSAILDTTPPVVTFTVSKRAEVADSISVRATDQSGITVLGWTASWTANGVPQSKTDSVTSGGSLTDFSHTFSLNLPITAFATNVVITAFAWDGATPPNRGVATQSATAAASPPLLDTVTIVAGHTYKLPAGSQIGDALYHPNRNKLYLSNIPYSRLEVFNLATNSFEAPIAVGSRPAGIALYPADTLGNVTDSLIVANSGGTNLSIVNTITGFEARRVALPVYQLHTVKTQANNAGGFDLIYTEYLLSDRPFFVASTCITKYTRGTTCDLVRAVYSTTGTVAQTTPLGKDGYLAWADLNPGALAGPHRHLVYEHAAPDRPTDTLEIVAVLDSIPGQQIRDTVLGAGIGVRAFPKEILFADSTLVRNSGDYQHVLVGEGGNVSFARALTYDARRGTGSHVNMGNGSCKIGVAPFALQLNCVGTSDTAVSDPTFVGQFVVNRSSRVSSIATNFNGRTNLVRADSIYAFDFILRQTGIVQIGGQAVGMDFFPLNDFDAQTRTGGGGKCTAAGFNYQDCRLLFAARPDSSIDVFDTYFYGRVTDNTVGAASIPIPVRDALVGPVRIATAGGNTVMFGVTSAGLVVVQLPTIHNSLFPAPARRGTYSPQASGPATQLRR